MDSLNRLTSLLNLTLVHRLKYYEQLPPAIEDQPNNIYFTTHFDLCFRLLKRTAHNIIIDQSFKNDFPTNYYLITYHAFERF